MNKIERLTKYSNVQLKRVIIAKLKILKAKRDDPTYDKTMEYLLSKEKLEFKK